MNKFFLYLTGIVSLVSSLLVAEDPKKNLKGTTEAVSKPESAAEISKVSEAFGHYIASNLENFGFQFDMNHFIKGLQDATAGKVAPMTEEECLQAITTAQQTAFKLKAQENLDTANEFLAANGKKEDIVTSAEGKLQYKIEKEGEGQTVEAHFSPVIRYVGKYLNGETFGASKEDEVVALDETIPGLSQGVVGMKEGEKRTLYIHPDLAYGTAGFLAPNSLLTFEIEIVKANAPQQMETADSVSVQPADAKAKASAEVAAPMQETPAVR